MASARIRNRRTSSLLCPVTLVNGNKLNANKWIVKILYILGILKKKKIKQDMDRTRKGHFIQGKPDTERQRSHTFSHLSLLASNLEIGEQS